jgi:4-hydroxybutyrate dehydrogenase
MTPPRRKIFMMIPMLQLPRTQFGFGAIESLPEELAALGIERPLFVTDQGVVACGVFLAVRRAATQFGGAAFDGIPENPTVDAVARIVEAYRADGCDGIVAIGGGSVIDAAKAAALLSTHPGALADYFGQGDKITSTVAPLIAIPTTAGTGSEASRGAGIHPNARSRASSIGSPYLVPKFAICDPDLTMTLPARLTAATGIDALTHCIEGYLSTFVSPPADAIALAGIRRIFANLPSAVAHGSDREARSQMMLAALEGGISLSKGAGPAHAIANTLGDRGMHHGMLVTLAMPMVLRMMENRAIAKMTPLREAMGAAPGETAADAFAALARRVGLPATARDVGYGPDDLDEMAQDAAGSFFNLRSPYRPTVSEYRTMIADLF